MNSDGASKEASQSAGCGGVLREVDGQWVGGFAQNLGFTTAYMAERCGGGEGVFEGLKVAHLLGVQALEVQLDSLVVVKILTEDGVGT